MKQLSEGQLSSATNANANSKGSETVLDNHSSARLLGQIKIVQVPPCYTESFLVGELGLQWESVSALYPIQRAQPRSHFMAPTLPTKSTEGVN